MDKFRIRYSKTGKAKYISHLDLVTTMQRAFTRAGVALRYSEGYNPHPYISVALPASVGVESECEILDIALSGGNIGSGVNEYLPDGLEIQSAYRPWRGFGDIKWLDAEFRVFFCDEITSAMLSALEVIFTANSLFITKKTKRGISTVDIAPHITGAVFNNNNDMSCITFFAKISAQNPTVSLKDLESVINTLYTDEVKKIPEFDRIEMKRVEIFDSNMVLFK